MKVKVGVSNRHIHLSENDLKILFGDNYMLTKLRDLTQSGDYACEEVVTIINNDRKIEKVRVVGPIREKTQVEISKTDSYYLGINPPIRDSRDLDDACKIIIKGPNCEIERKAVIISIRHIHMNFKEAEELGLRDKDIVRIKLYGEKGGILENVHVKVSNEYNLELHLDLDDANAHDVKNGDIAEILKN